MKTSNRPSLREAARRGLAAKQQQQAAAEVVQAPAAPRQRSPGGRPPPPGEAARQLPHALRRQGRGCQGLAEGHLSWGADAGLEAGL
jgi:hypothetical protein